MPKWLWRGRHQLLVVRSNVVYEVFEMRICNRSKWTLERFYNEDFEVRTMLCDRYEHIFEVVLDSADTVARHNHFCIKRGDVEARNVNSLGPSTIRWSDSGHYASLNNSDFATFPWLLDLNVLAVRKQQAVDQVPVRQSPRRIMYLFHYPQWVLLLGKKVVQLKGLCPLVTVTARRWKDLLLNRD